MFHLSKTRILFSSPSTDWLNIFALRTRGGSDRGRSAETNPGARPKTGVNSAVGFSLKLCTHRRGRSAQEPGLGSPDDFQSYSDGQYNASGATYAELNTYCEIPDRSGLSSAYGNVEEQGSNPSSAYYSDASVNSHRGGRHSPSQASVEVATICGGNHHHHHAQPGLHHPHEILGPGVRPVPGLQLAMHPARNVPHHHHWFSAPRASNVCNCGRMRGARLPQPGRGGWVIPLAETIVAPPNATPPSPPPPRMPLQHSYPHLVELHHVHHHRQHVHPDGEDFTRRPSQRQVNRDDGGTDAMNGSGSDSGIMVSSSGPLAAAQHAPQPSSPASTGTESSFLLSTGQTQASDRELFELPANRPMTVINHHPCMCPNHVHMIDSQHQRGNMHMDHRCRSFVPSEYI
ncbi:unnamed protein product [Notodromas monacha]|uniref:Uncharacterized protein n=1 Tax=Notodromas monacha TaxID=399045 RepID=A0A7R9BDU6_9CRUS|nr:unnamed protein product [Notodromas monacha]CAG0912835.1 unnamed protein product [Notodromas monacha]